MFPGRRIRADTRTNRAARVWVWSLSRRGLAKDHLLPEGFHVIAYRATLNVPRELAWFVARLPLAERRRRGTRAGPVR
jgi:hypothetical protein